MGTYSKECLDVFLEKQGKLFDEKVAETREEAEEFLEDVMAVVVSSAGEVREYLEESGMDTEGISNQELLEEAEVFALPGGTYLIVEA